MAENITAHMDKSLESLKHNFSKVRTGRANANILSDITVDYYGVPTPVTQVAAVKTPEAHMLLIEPWDKALINAIVKAIGASDLGITPNSDGTVVRLPFPAPTEERRRELVKECREYAEQAKVSIRNIRRDFNNKLERDEELTEDDVRREQAKVQKHTDEYVAKVEELLKEKKPRSWRSKVQYDEHKLVEYFADAPVGVGFSDLDLNNIPHHISCIMDGNGRWATSRGLARTEGHKAGIVSLREIITACVRLGVDVLSAYAFSTENWNLPQHEVNVLMHLFAKTFIDELPLLKRENVRVVFLGDISALPKKTRDVFERGLAECADHTGMTLALAVNYGARAEITRAVRQIALDAAAGKIDPAAIDDDMVASHLYTAGLPDPELVIRTSGELRLSNYLLWQVAYSEFYVTDTYWPDFDRWGLVDAILAYQGRDRRFGGLSKTEEA